MNKKELLLNKLKDLKNNNDTEIAHLRADEALIDYINDSDIRKAFNKISKWYA